MLARVRERRFEPFGAERLQHVVERVHLECAERVLVVRRDEHDRRHPIAERARQLQPVHLRHLDVEKHEIRGRELDSRDRVHSRLALADDLDVRLALKQRQHARARHGLVVHDERPDFLRQHAHHATPTSTSVGLSIWNGMRIVTQNPRSRFENVNW